MSRGPFLRCALTISATVAIISSARADTLQNTASDASSAQLTAAGFGNLNGTGINVGVVEAGGFAAAYYGNVAANTISPNSSLPNGNPDLPGANINFVQSGHLSFNLPGGQLPQGNNAPPINDDISYDIDNHATEVSGVIMGQGATAAADRGISPNAGLAFAALDPSLNTRPAEDNDAATDIQWVLQNRNTPIVNNSWGFVEADANNNQYAPALNGANQPLFLTTANGAAAAGALPANQYATYSDGSMIPLYKLNNTSGNSIAANNTISTANNGGSVVSKFVDWAAGAYDSLVVVAGNEGPQITGLNATQGYFSAPGNGPADIHLETGSPSDSYNSVNVGATGARGYISNGTSFVVDNNNGATLNYGIAASYNTSNMTSDVSAITGYGRLKTDIVAPGGDPKLNNFPSGTFANPPVFSSQFQSTAGGQYSYAFNINIAADGDPPKYVPFYSNDVFNGANPALVPANVTTATPFVASNVSLVDPPFDSANWPPKNPAPPNSFANGDVVLSGNAIAGTSFAAPAVSGAASLIYQYYQTQPPLQGWSVDHRLVKAILLNAASHFYNGPLGVQPLMESDNATPWTRLQGKGITPLPIGTIAAQFGGSNPTVRPGLDPQLGTGMLDVVGSLRNYAAGRQGPGLVTPTGWDVNTVLAGSLANTITQAYTFNTSGGTFSATLDWDDPVAITNPGANNTWQEASGLNRGMLTDLDLYLFTVNPANGSLIQDVDYSTSDIDNVEYLYDTLPAGTYQIDVVNAQFVAAQDTTYGLAWAAPVPEPASVCLMTLGGIALMLIYRRRRASEAAMSFAV
jgi:hypothetical protein